MGMVKFTVHGGDWFENAEKKIHTAASKSELALAGIVQKDTDQFVPARTGSLSIRTHVVEVHGYVAIVYPGLYARNLYHGKLMVDPETGSAWARKGVTKVKAQPERDLDIKKTVHPQAQSYWFEVAKAQDMDTWEREGKGLMKRELSD